MKYKVKNNFQDKHTGNFYGKNRVFETASEERASELIQAGFLHPADSESKKRSPKKKSTSESKGAEVLDQTVDEVKEAVTGEYSEDELNSLLEQESAGDNRKGVKEHIESLLEDKKE